MNLSHMPIVSVSSGSGALFGLLGSANGAAAAGSTKQDALFAASMLQAMPQGEVARLPGAASPILLQLGSDWAQAPDIPGFTIGDSGSAAPTDGELLLHWLDNLGEDEMSDLAQIAELPPLIELAQILVQQWQTDGAAKGSTQDEQLSGSETATVDKELGTAARFAEWLTTLRQLTVLLERHPEAPDLVHTVRAIEAQLLANSNLSDMRLPQHGRLPDTGAAGLSSKVAGELPTNPLTAKASGGNPAPVTSETMRQAAQVVEQLVRGSDLRGRLEEMAARSAVPANLLVAQTEKLPEATNIHVEVASASLEVSNEWNVSQMGLQTKSGTSGQEAPLPVVHAGRFAEDMAQILRSMKLHTNGSLSEVRVMLRPEHLGQLDVKVTLQNGQLIALFTTESARGKELLESQMAQLKAVLQMQGLQVERLEVTVYEPRQSGSFQDSGQRNPRQSGRESDQNDSDPNSDAGEFLKELERLAARSAVTGVDVTV